MRATRPRKGGSDFDLNAIKVADRASCDDVEMVALTKQLFMARETVVPHFFPCVVRHIDGRVLNLGALSVIINRKTICDDKDCI